MLLAKMQECRRYQDACNKLLSVIEVSISDPSAPQHIINARSKDLFQAFELVGTGKSVKEDKDRE